MLLWKFTPAAEDRSYVLGKILGFKDFIQHWFIYSFRPSNGEVSEDAGIEPRTGILEQSMGAAAE